MLIQSESRSVSSPISVALIGYRIKGMLNVIVDGRTLNNTATDYTQDVAVYKYYSLISQNFKLPRAIPKIQK